jgi:hypothetical protein
MYQSIPFLSLPADSQTAIPQATQALQAKGLRVLPSFDLQVARASHLHCNCPHHGTEQCDCQLVVLLVYDHAETPVTVVAHTTNGETLFELVDSPQQPANPQIRDRIRSALFPLKDSYLDADIPGLA